ncbi:MAG: PHP domain-containing protein [Halobacteriota archaeon]|jgi:hypothetical protein
MRFDLHIHSHFSPDSNSSVEAILKQALEVGLDGLAITDHNSVQSFFDAVRLTEDLGLNLIIVPGAEISTTEGHLITLGNHTLVPPGLSASETSKRAHDGYGIVVAPHPFELFRNGIRNLRNKRIDAVEAFNSRDLLGVSNYLATRSAAKLNLGVTGGSDSHYVETVGFGYTEVDAASGVTVQDILRAIQAGRSKAGGHVSPRLRSTSYSLKARVLNHRNSR